MLTSAVIVPTYNRPEDLGNFVRSLLQQTVLPDEFIIVDDGDLKSPPLAEECKAAGIKLVYFKKDAPGLTASRNAGIGLATADVVFFFDDDVALFPEYLETILKIYADDKSAAVGGASGIDMNLPPLDGKDRWRRIFDVLFLVSGFAEGKVLPSGFCTEYGATGRVARKRREVDFLPGCSFSFRKEVFRDFLFDARGFLNYGMGEDKDFSYRVSRKYKLVYEPQARLLHLHSPHMRPDHYKSGRMFALFMHAFFTRYGGKNAVHRLLFYYALLGHAVTKSVVLVFARKKSVYDYVRGLLKGIGEIMRGKTGMVGQ